MKNIAVIIPTYNRAHLLLKTIPTYIKQTGKNFLIKEIILIDDCSTDNTQETIKELKNMFPEVKIKYNRMVKNSKQPACLNRGIELLGSDIDYVYFGDDDAILVSNSIKYLVEILENYKADLVGARALWAKNISEIENYDSFIKKIDTIEVSGSVVDFDRDIFNFDKNYLEPQIVPVTHSYFIIKKNIIEETRFSEEYKENAYREETDFILEINKKGKKIMYDSRAIGINYPRNIATGGAHKKGILGKLKWYYWAVKNNNIFLEKHYSYLKRQDYVKRNKTSLKLIFIFKQGFRIIVAGLKKIKLNTI